jgi:dTDP-4-amino-4,6-dideoxygalactose transaminase
MSTKISWWRTEFATGEAERIAESIAHEHVSQGQVTAEFEQALGEVLDVPYVVATTSGSTALLMALMAAGVGPGDEVIVPNRTWIATAHAAMMLGARVVLVDVEEDRPIIDAAAIEAKITPRTRVIMPVHLNGRSADMGAITAIAKRHGIRVVEDAAQAIGSRNGAGPIGTQGDLGCFSLSVAKLIATGQGGFVVTRDEMLHRALKSVRTHGVADVVNAEWTRLGFNFRFTDILASIGVVQLAKLPQRVEKARAIYEAYRRGIETLGQVRLIPVDLEAGEVPVYAEVLCAHRERLLVHLASHDIEARPFYPDLDHAAYLGNEGAFPNSRKYGSEGVYLPSGPAQPMENVHRVIEALRSFR